MISAIVYTSNSGYTAEYARMLGELTGLPVYDLHRVSDPQPQREVVFLGWLMAGNVKGYAKADRLYKVRAVCQVGMGPATKAASDKLRQKLKLSPEVQVFTLQGGFDIRRLHGQEHVPQLGIAFGVDHLPDLIQQCVHFVFQIQHGMFLLSADGFSLRA